MKGQHTRWRENDELPLWQVPALRQKLPFLNVHALITCEIMRRKDARCNKQSDSQEASKKYLLEIFTSFNSERYTPKQNLVRKVRDELISCVTDCRK